jgi:hypothetical protein
MRKVTATLAFSVTALAMAACGDVAQSGLLDAGGGLSDAPGTTAITTRDAAQAQADAAFDSPVVVKEAGTSADAWSTDGPRRPHDAGHGVDAWSGADGGYPVDGWTDGGALGDTGSTSGPDSGADDAGSDCTALSACCGTLPLSSESSCFATVTSGNASECSGYLSALQATGYCNGPDGGHSDSDAGTLLAKFEFVVNGVQRTPLACTSEAWEFPAVGANLASVTINNSGTVPIAYIVQVPPQGGWWVPGAHYIPDVASGGGGELVGVLDPGSQLNVSAEFDGFMLSQNLLALLGSAAPFSTPGLRTITDEGSIPWPVGVPGSGGATVMQLAEIEVESDCTQPFQAW